jgi:hypothetical protein
MKREPTVKERNVQIHIKSLILILMHRLKLVMI